MSWNWPSMPCWHGGKNGVASPKCTESQTKTSQFSFCPQNIWVNWYQSFFFLVLFKEFWGMWNVNCIISIINIILKTSDQSAISFFSELQNMYVWLAYIYSEIPQPYILLSDGLTQIQSLISKYLLWFRSFNQTSQVLIFWNGIRFLQQRSRGAVPSISISRLPTFFFFFSKTCLRTQKSNADTHDY